jgi:acyl carrier protein
MTEVETRVCEIVGDDLHIECVRLADDLIHDHGVDELGLMSVAMRLEEEFHLGERSVSEEALIGESTVGKCVELVSQAMCLAHA